MVREVVKRRQPLPINLLRLVEFGRLSEMASERSLFNRVYKVATHGDTACAETHQRQSFPDH